MFTWIATKLGSTILEYVAGGVVILLLAGGGYYTVKYAWYSWFERPKLEKEVTELQNAAIKLRADNYRQQAQIKDLEYTKKAKVRQTNEDQIIDKIIQDNDDPAMRKFFMDHGMLPPSQTGTPAPGNRSSPGH